MRVEFQVRKDTKLDRFDVYQISYDQNLIYIKLMMRGFEQYFNACSFAFSKEKEEQAK